MTRIEELLEDYKYHQKMLDEAIANCERHRTAYANNHLSILQRQLHNLGINMTQIKRLVNA
jgi:hypothetical protein